MNKDQRRSERRSASHLAVYYWDGATPEAHAVRDVSFTGLYLLTEHRWYPGTYVMLTLQRMGEPEPGVPRSILVRSKVVRAGADGVGLAFVLAASADGTAPQDTGASPVDRKGLERFLQKALTNGSRPSGMDAER